MQTSARCYLELPEGAREIAASDAASLREVNEKSVETMDQPTLVNGTSESKESSVVDKVRLVFEYRRFRLLIIMYNSFTE